MAFMGKYCSLMKFLLCTIDTISHFLYLSIIWIIGHEKEDERVHLVDLDKTIKGYYTEYMDKESRSDVVFDFLARYVKKCIRICTSRKRSLRTRG